MAELPFCPECGSERLYKDGMRYRADGSTVQRFLCRNCGFRFSDPTQKIKNQRSYNSSCRVGAPGPNPGIAKNSAGQAIVLAEEKASTTGGLAGAIETTQQNVKGLILTYLVHLKNEGYKETTIKQKEDLLCRLVSLGANLLSPESVKRAIASIDRSESYKLLLCIAYEGFAKYHKIQGWTRPNYKQCEKLPFIPYEEEINDLISGTGKKTSAFLKLLKETAMRFREAWCLKWIDVDFKNHVVTCNEPEKGSRARIFKISSELAAMLDKLKRKSIYIFGDSDNYRMHVYRGHGFKVSFMMQRKRLASKLQNPRLLKITFHGIRHWKATMVYHETKDILYTMKFLGHKSIKNTLIYIDLERACFPKVDDSYHVRIAETPEEITRLLEAGFEYVMQKDGLVYLRKRK